MKKYIISNMHYIIFIIISLLALNINYVEGDDASMIMYHALGRDINIQPAYSVYHSMFDKILSILPTDEFLLRSISIIISCVSSFFVYYFLLQLLKLKGLYNRLFVFFIPFILPEMFFSGLYINPTIISFSIILLSHLFLLYSFKEGKEKFIFFSIILLGFGVSIRWNNAFYISFLFGEYVVFYFNKRKRLFDYNRLTNTAFVFVAYILSFLFFIWLSGYTIKDIIQIYTQGSAYLSNKEVSYLSYVAKATTYLTPAFLALLICGLYYIIKNKNRKLLILLVFCFLPYLSIGIYISYKFMITTLPLFIIIMSYGYHMLTKKYLRVSVFVLIITPCLLGVKVYSNSSFGPGYTIKLSTDQVLNNKNSYNPDNRTKIDKIRVGFYGGLAMPTPEGPRPLGGYLWVLLGGWSDIVDNINTQRLNAVNYAIEHNAIILQDVNHSFISTKLLELGYNTEEPFYNSQGDYSLRKYTKGVDDVYFIVPNDKNKLFDDFFLSKIKSSKEIVLYSSYTNIINKLRESPNFVYKNTYWGVMYENKVKN